MARYKEKNDHAEPYDYNGLIIWVNKYKSEESGVYFAELNYRNPLDGEVLTELETKTSGHTEEEREGNIYKKGLPTIAKKIIKRDNSIHKMDLSVYSYWILNKDDIAERRDWGRDTIKYYTRIMDLAGPELGAEPMKDKSIQDYMQGVKKAAAKHHMSDKDITKIYKLLELLWSYASVRGGCSGDNPITVYLEGKKTKKEYAPIVKDHFKPGAINRSVQKKIMEVIESRINDDGQYLGIALMLFAGLSPNEACALDFKDVHIDDEITSLLIRRQYIKTRGKKKAHFDELDSINAYREIPVADALVALISMRRQVMGGGRRNDAKPLVCNKNQLNNRVKPDKLKELSIEVLLRAGQKDRIIKNPNSGQDDIVLHVEDNIYRSNIQFVLRQGGMDNDEINYFSGRAVHDTVYKHYVDFFNPQTQIVFKTIIDDWVRILTNSGLNNDDD